MGVLVSMSVSVKLPAMSQSGRSLEPELELAL